MKRELREGERGVADRRLFALLFSLLILLHILLICTRRIYPFTDLPFHLSAATIFRHHGEPTNRFDEYFKVDLSAKPNVFHIFFCGLPIFPDVESANRVFYCLYVISLPLAVLLLIGKLGGNPWLSLLSFLLMYNFSVLWGFSGFTISIPLLLLLFYLLLFYFEDGRFYPLVGAAFILLFLMHALATVFALAVFFLCCAYRYRASPGKMLLRATAALPVMALIVAWRLGDPTKTKVGTARFLALYYENNYLKSLLERVRDLPFLDNYFLYGGVSGRLVAFLFFCCLVLPLGWAAFRLRGRLFEGEKRRAGFLLLAVLLLIYLAVPGTLPDVYMIHQRFSVLIFLALVVLSSLYFRDGLPRPIKATLAAAALVHLLLWTGYFVEFDRENESFSTEILPDEGMNNRLAGLMYDMGFRGRAKYLHFADYYIVWKKGIASTCLVDYRFGAIRRKVGLKKLPRYRGLDWAGRLGGWYDRRFEFMEYILIRGEAPIGVKTRLRMFRRLRSAEKWTLYERIGKLQ